MLSHSKAQGPRPTQEDRTLAIRLNAPFAQGWLLGVFDGHGGSEAAEYCVEAFPTAFCQELEQTQVVGDALVGAFGALDDGTRDMIAGSTASVTYVAEQGTAWVAVLGDSPVIVRDASGGRRIGPLHHASVEVERDAAVERGAEYRSGYLWSRGGQAIMVTRALGSGLFPFLGRDPEVFSFQWGSGSYALAASDGVLAGVGEPVLTELVSMIDVAIDGGDSAKEIVSMAVSRGASDNVAVALWRAGVNL